MEKQKREICVGEESDEEVNHGQGSNEDNGKHKYCYDSVPASKLQPRKILSVARWDCEIGMAEVETHRGSIWTTTGIVRKGKIYCSIEEVLFLAEIGALMLMNDVGARLSLKDMYIKVSDERNGCCWDFFQAYRELKSLGYIVSRHGIPWSLKSVNCNGGSSSSSTPPEDEISITTMFSRMQIEEAWPVFDVYTPDSKFRKSCPGDPSFVLCFTRDGPPSTAALKSLRKECRFPLKFCHVEQGTVGFFSFDDYELPVLP